MCWPVVKRGCHRFPLNIAYVDGDLASVIRATASPGHPVFANEQKGELIAARVFKAYAMHGAGRFAVPVLFVAVVESRFVQVVGVVETHMAGVQVRADRWKGDGGMPCAAVASHHSLAGKTGDA